MSFLKRLSQNFSDDEEEDPRPLIDWLGNDEDDIELGRVEYFDVFLEGVREVAPHGSILVLEGKPAANVRRFLEAVRLVSEVRIARGTEWLKQALFHIPQQGKISTGCLNSRSTTQSRRYATTWCSTKGRQALLWLHDAGDGYFFGHPALGEAELKRVQNRLKRKSR